MRLAFQQFPVKTLGEKGTFGHLIDRTVMLACTRSSTMCCSTRCVGSAQAGSTQAGSAQAGTHAFMCEDYILMCCSTPAVWLISDDAV